MPDSSPSLRDRLATARVMLIFSPQVCGARDPLAVLDAVLDHVDVVQVRPKPLATGRGDAPAPAGETRDWTRRALELAARRARPPLVIANDRVDVAMLLAHEGCAGVHLGQDDLPPSEARELLGPGPLIGLSTHDLAQVARASDLALDYLGFGPVFPSATKGYARGLGAEACWVAATAATVPLFAIGGVTRARLAELERIERVAVGADVLSADDPARAARELRELLVGE